MGDDKGGPQSLVAFLGPSLAEDDARRLLPGVELLPPICQGDLSTVVEGIRPRGVLIVDGEFGQSLSVWHKEILHAIHVGVRVIGASSMGALRAAELDRFGMEGVGAIYAHYRDGWLTADADVALLHADAADSYRPLTWPLVNIRATVAALVDGDLLASARADAVMMATGGLHFADRTPAAVTKQLRADGMAGDDAEALTALISAHYIDQKAIDAVAGFEHLGRLDQIPAPVAEEPRFRDGRGFQPLRWSDVTLRRPTGSLRRYQLVNDVALHHRDFGGLLRRALDRYLVAEVAGVVDIELTTEEVDAQRIRTCARLGITDETLDEWLRANDTDRPAFDGLVRDEAMGDRMRRWLVDMQLYERTRRMVIEQLQLDGEYAAAADAAARRRSLADAQPTPPYPRTREAIVELVTRHMAETPWRPHTDLISLADEHGFDNLQTLLVALSDANAASVERRRRRDRAARMLGFDTPKTDAAATAPDVDELRMLAMLEAHQITQVLLAGVELGLPDALADGPATISDLASATATHPGRLERMMRALQAAATVTIDDDGRWSLTAVGRALTSRRGERDATLGDYALHLRDDAFRSWEGLADVVRGADPPDYPVDERADRLISAATSALGLQDAVVRAVNPPPDGHVVDIGGGLGTTLAALVDAHPGVTGTLVELSATATRAAARLAASGATGIDVVAYGDGHATIRPADSCVLGRVIVTLDDEAAVDLLAYARRNLSTTGTIEVFDLERDSTSASAFGDVLNLARSGGAVRSPGEWRELGRRAGLHLDHRRSITPPFVHLTFRPLEDEQRC